jgi:hypothetical protein
MDADGDAVMVEPYSPFVRKATQFRTATPWKTV